MAKKHEIDLELYTKAPRRLSRAMMEALGPGADLSPVLEAVSGEKELRLDIRDGRFNVYYRGGSLLRLGHHSPQWNMRFDEQYFRGRTGGLPKLPAQFTSIEDSRKWVAAFPQLKQGMDRWWDGNPRRERDHCQNMARDNSPRDPQVSSAYLVLDIEYQWAHRRFDLIAARRQPSDADPSGWVEPGLVFVEVKSDLATCFGKSGIAEHASDFSEIVRVRGGGAAEDIKHEYEGVIDQKRCLGQFSESIGFRQFSAERPELLLVLVDFDPRGARWRKLLHKIAKDAHEAGTTDSIQFMRLSSSGYTMAEAGIMTLDQEQTRAGL